MKPVNTHPKMLDWEWFDDSFCVHIMYFLLLQANQVATTFKGNIVKRGQVVAGRGKISGGTSIPEQIVRTRMNRMIKSGDFSIEVIKADGRDYSIITITDYDEYQKNEPAKRETTINKKRRSKEGENKDIPLTPLVECDLPISALEEPRRGIIKTWVDHKREKKQAYRPMGLTALITKMGKFDDDTVKQAIENSMSSGHAGLFPESIASQATDKSHIHDF